MSKNLVPSRGSLRSFLSLAFLAALPLAAAGQGHVAASGESPSPIPWRSEAARALATRAAGLNPGQQLEALRAEVGTHVVLQFARPILPEERTTLAQRGVHLLNYLGSNAYFATLAPRALDAGGLATVEPLVAA